MIKWKVEVSPRNIRGILEEDILGCYRQALDTWRDTVVQVSQEKVPVDKGGLADSIDFQSVDEPDHKIISYNQDYAVYVEYGTGVYGEGEGASKQPIRPKKKKALHWVNRSTGADVFAKEVLGQKPQPYMRPAFDEATQNLVDDVRLNLRPTHPPQPHKQRPPRTHRDYAVRIR